MRLYKSEKSFIKETTLISLWQSAIFVDLESKLAFVSTVGKNRWKENCSSYFTIYSIMEWACRKARSLLLVNLRGGVLPKKRKLHIAYDKAKFSVDQESKLTILSKLQIIKVGREFFVLFQSYTWYIEKILRGGVYQNRKKFTFQVTKCHFWRPGVKIRGCVCIGNDVFKQSFCSEFPIYAAV